MLGLKAVNGKRGKHTAEGKVGKGPGPGGNKAQHEVWASVERSSGRLYSGTKD